MYKTPLLHLRQLLVWQFILLGCFTSVAQNTSNLDSLNSFTLIKELPLPGKKIESDRLGSWYLVSPSNQLYKYSSDGKLLSTLNYNYQGNIDQLDVTNPLEIYVFYRELNKLVFLDNTLSFRGEMALSDAGISQASSIARSYDNGIWVFDMSDLQLKKIDKDGKLLQSSGNIKQYLSKEPVFPIQIIDNGTNVFVNDPINGVLVFDLFGTYIKTVSITNCLKIKVIDDLIYSVSKGELHAHKLGFIGNPYYPLPIKSDVLQFDINKKHLFILTGSTLRIYTH